MIMLAVLSPLFAYLIGSISFAVIFTEYFSKFDVRKKGSGNAGTTNVLRVAGIKAGVLTFLCDAVKGAVACLIGKYFFSLAFNDPKTVLLGAYLCGFACMLGHAYPLFFDFKGGKCAATSVGIFAVCCPQGIILGLLGYAINMAITRIVSLSTLVATTIVVVVSFVQKGFLTYGVQPVILVLTVLMGVLVFYRHKSNIQKLIKGEEKKLKIKK